MVTLGAAGYAFLTAAGRAVSARDFAALQALYLLAALLGPGVFAAVEQETSRRVSQCLARGLGTRAVVRRMALLSGAILLVTLALIAGTGAVLVRRVFAGHDVLLLALALSTVGYWGAHLSRGLFGGQRRFRAYGANVGAEGMVRLLPCLVLVLAGSTGAGPYGLALGLAPAAAVLVTARWLRVGSPGPCAGWADLTRSLGWLLCAWLLSQAMANVAPIIVTALLPADPQRAATFGAAFILARVPYFAFAAAQAVLLPTLTRTATHGDMPGLRLAIRQACAVVALLGGGSVVGFAALGAPILRVVFGADYTISSWVVALLGVGTLLLMAVQVLQPALLALAHHHVVGVAWCGGVGGFAACFWLPVDPVTAALVAQLVGAGVTAGVLAVGLRSAVRRRTAALLRAAVPAPLAAGE